jgi:hypothetical protein
LLFPGNFAGGYLAEKALWHSGLNLFQMQLLQVPLAIAINLAVWAFCAWAFRRTALRLKPPSGNAAEH